MGVHRTCSGLHEIELAATHQIERCWRAVRYRSANWVMQQMVRVSRSISPRWGSIRFRLAPHTHTPCGPCVRVVPNHLTKSRKIPTRKIVPLFSFEQVPALPIGWGDPGTFGPMSQLGMREWQVRAAPWFAAARQSGGARESPDRAHAVTPPPVTAGTRTLACTAGPPELCTAWRHLTYTHPHTHIHTRTFVAPVPGVPRVTPPGAAAADCRTLRLACRSSSRSTPPPSPRAAWPPVSTRCGTTASCTPREPFNSTPMGVNSISPAHLHVRPMGRTCR